MLPHLDFPRITQRFAGPAEIPRRAEIEVLGELAQDVVRDMDHLPRSGAGRTAVTAHIDAK